MPDPIPASGELIVSYFNTVSADITHVRAQLQGKNPLAVPTWEIPGFRKDNPNVAWLKSFKEKGVTPEMDPQHFSVTHVSETGFDMNGKNYKKTSRAEREIIMNPITKEPVLIERLYDVQDNSLVRVTTIQKETLNGIKQVIFTVSDEDRNPHKWWGFDDAVLPDAYYVDLRVDDGDPHDLLNIPQPAVAYFSPIISEYAQSEVNVGASNARAAELQRSWKRK